MIKSEIKDQETEEAISVSAEERKKIIIERYGLVRKNSGAIGRNDVCVHFKTDEKPVNQGVCFYNYTLDTFYFSPRRSRGDEPVETIFCDIERENPHYNYQEISFYVTG